MLGFRKLDVYKCAVQALAMAYALSERGDPEIKKQLRRAALSITLNIAEGTGRRDDDQRQFYRIARGSALECGAIADALVILDRASPADIAALDDLLVRIVSMLTRMV